MPIPVYRLPEWNFGFCVRSVPTPRKRLLIVVNPQKEKTLARNRGGFVGMKIIDDNYSALSRPPRHP